MVKELDHMAITATLVFAGSNRLRYLVVATAGTESVSITSSGAATPDLQTDSLAGPIKRISRVTAAGYGKLAAGVPSTANARALLFSDLAAAAIGAAVPTALCRLTPRTGATQNAVVDAPLGDGSFGLTVTGNTVGSWYLDVEIPGQIGF